MGSQLELGIGFPNHLIVAESLCFFSIFPVFPMGNLPEIGNLFREFSVLSATTAEFVGEDVEVDDKVFPPELMNLLGACCM